MKKVLALILFLAMTVSLCAVPALGNSFRPGEGPVTVTVRKTDPSYVVKDGVIGYGEYDRLEIDLEEDSTPLNICFWTGDDIEDAEAMMKTMEYYFSWDEVHGFNFAVRNKPTEIKQVIPEGTGDPPEDAFLHNVGYTFVADPQPDLGILADTLFYYAVARDTVTGAYKEGHYNQLGLKGYYNPAEGVDYCITYDYDTGYVTLEWSVPFDNFMENTPADGVVFCFSVGAEGGPGETAASDRGYAVALGDWSWLVAAKSSESHVIATLSEDTIVKEPENGEETGETGETGNTGNNENPGTGTNETPGTGANETPGTGTNENPGTGANENPGAGTNENPGNGGKTAPKTGDPMIVMAAVAALSAAGAFIVGKKRH